MSEEKYRQIGIICDYDEDIEKFYKTPLYLDDKLNYYALTPNGEMFKVSERFLWVMFSCPLREQCLMFGYNVENNLYSAHYQAFHEGKKRYELIGVGNDPLHAYAELSVYFDVLYQNFNMDAFEQYVAKEMKDENIGEFNYNPLPEEFPEEFMNETFIY